MTPLEAMRHDEAVKTIALDELSKVTPHEKVYVQKEGRLVGTFMPFSGSDESIPLDERKKRFLELSERLGRRLNELGVTEEEIERDLEAWKKTRRGR